MKLTYYEDAMFDKKDFKNNGCNGYIGLMEKYLKNGEWKNWDGKQIEQMDKPPYLDPDNSDKKWNCSYFGELTQFLNEQEKWLKEKMGDKNPSYLYVAPKWCHKAGQEDSRHPGSDANEIRVYYNDDVKFYLRSDQFGFTVGNDRDDFKNHPYGYLCELVKKTKNQEEEKKNEVYEEIAKCIYHTRTLGGGFLWQSDPTYANSKESIYGYYNIHRGVKSYIEDRVDLTLLEIKHLFEWIKKIKAPIKDDLLSSRVIEYKERIGVKEYIEWLEHFDTFENYIQFFCFDDFVDSDKTWMPLDILKSKLKSNGENKDQDKKVFLEDSTKYKQSEKFSIKNLSFEKMEQRLGNKLNEDDVQESLRTLKQMLENVRILTHDRSDRMQKVIDGTSD